MGRKSKAEIARLAWLEQIERWVSEGKPQAILQDLIDHHTELWNRTDRLKAIDRAVAAAADKGAGYLIQVSFERMLATYIAIQLRLEYAMNRRMGSWEDSGGDACVTDELWQTLRTELDRTYNRICQISKTFASVQHVMGLSDRSGEAAFKDRVLRLVRQAAESPQDPVEDPPETKVG